MVDEVVRLVRDPERWEGLLLGVRWVLKEVVVKVALVEMDYL